MKEGVDCEQSEQDGVVVIFNFFMATDVAVHNYLPLLTQGTPSFIKKETARRAVVLLSAMPTHQLNSENCTLIKNRPGDTWAEYKQPNDGGC